MTAVTQILEQVASGQAGAADELLPLVYDELRAIAAQKLAHERPGQTLQATALVHEAYLRLVGPKDRAPQLWENRRHFFAAAAEAMRRILVENARRNARFRHGGGCVRIKRDDALDSVASQALDDDVLAVHEVLDDLERVDAQAAKLVKLRYFLGLTFGEAAELLDISERTAYRTWSFARAWLYERLKDQDSAILPEITSPPRK